MKKDMVYYCTHCGKIWKYKPKSGFCTRHCGQIVEDISDIVDTIQYNHFVYGKYSLSDVTNVPCFGSTIIRVDKDMVPILNLCRETDITTRWCCIGHDNSFSYLTIDYDEYMYEFIKIAYPNNNYVYIEKDYLFCNKDLNHLTLTFRNKYGNEEILAFWLEVTKIIMNYKTGGVLLPDKIQEKWSIVKINHIYKNLSNR